MQHFGIAWIFFLFAIPLTHAESLYDDPRLDQFVADLTDKYDKRHYALVSKQSAIHKYIIRDCMRNLGFEDESDADPGEWSRALHGEFAYCQGHHIPGIDPPCPAEATVEASIKNSCFQTAYDQIDWSHNIMHAARGNLPDDWKHDPADAAMQHIEAQWVACMELAGFHYKSRFAMFSSFGEVADLSLDAQASQPGEEDVLRAAEVCFETTDYYQKRSELKRAQIDDYYSRRYSEIGFTLGRYEAAERHADKLIQKYCETDKSAIISMYQLGNLSKDSICGGTQ